jgi:hypothetical protein
MAADFLNCSNNLLKEAAQKWAEKHQYRIMKSPVQTGYPVWGSQK